METFRPCCWCLPWGLPCSSLPSWFSGDASVFRSYSLRSFLLRSLRDFVGSPPAELLLCPFRALRLCFYHAASFPSCPRSLVLSMLSFSLPFSACLQFLFSCCPGGERFLQLVALFLLLLARPTLLPLPFRLHVLILPFVHVGCVGWQRLGFSPQCSFVFLTCGPFLISFRLSSFYHSDVQLSSSSVYGLGSLLGKRFFTLGFTCSHF